LRAIEVTRFGQTLLLLSTHSRSFPANSDWRRNRCFDPRISISVEPEIAERGWRRSAGSSTRVQFSHWSPRAAS
jgi:hypothetical protein